MFLQLPNPLPHEKYGFRKTLVSIMCIFMGNQDQIILFQVVWIKSNCVCWVVPGRNSSLNSTADCCFFQAAHGNSHILLSYTQDQLLEFTKNFPQYFFPCLAITLCHGNGISQQAVAEFSHAAATTAGHKHSHKHSQRSQHFHSFQIRFLNILTNWYNLRRKNAEISHFSTK